MLCCSGEHYRAIMALLFFMFCPVCCFSACLVDPVWYFDHTLEESWLLCLTLVCGICTVCHSLFALPLGVVGRLCSVIVIFWTTFVLFSNIFTALSLHKHNMQI